MSCCAPLFNNMMLKFFPLHVIQATLTGLLFVASLLSTTHSWEKNCPHYFWRTCERAHLVHCCHCYVHAGHAGHRLLELPPDKPIRRLHAGWPRPQPHGGGTIRRSIRHVGLATDGFAWHVVCQWLFRAMDSHWPAHRLLGELVLGSTAPSSLYGSIAGFVDVAVVFGKSPER